MSKNLNTKIFVAGHRGMVGSAILRQLKQLGYSDLITRTHDELDLINQEATEKFFESERPDQVYLAAAMVGGILANNTYPAEFIYRNLMIQSNVIHQSWRFGVKKLLFIGSSCAYPSPTVQPIKELALLNGKLEITSEPYSVAKIAGIKMCESYNRQYSTSHGIDYRSVIPAALYGPGDNYNLENSHVIPALIRKFHEGKLKKLPSVTIWGSGKPKREFLYVDDMAQASIFVMNLSREIYCKQTHQQSSHLNIGVGFDISIFELARKISKIVNFVGEIKFDHSKPDGAIRKLLDNDRLSQIYAPKLMDIDSGIEIAYRDFLLNYG
jgi:GDP-L-fucose synthase